MIYVFEDRRPRFDSSDWYVAPSAQVIGSVRLGDWASVWFGAVLRGDSEWIEIGARCNVQDGSVIHADPGTPTVLGAGVSIGHMVMLHGCVIGPDSLIGNGAIVLDGACVGQGSIVAAGSLVPPGKVIPNDVVVMGSPAKVVREATDADRALIAEASAHYVENVARYRKSLSELSDLRPI